MKNKNIIKIVLKIIILLLLSMLLHFLPNWFKFPGLEVFTPTSESIFQHEKILFFAYFPYSLIEYFILRRKLANGTSFWMSRFLILFSLPWLMIVIYLLPQAFFGKMPTVGWEVFLAIIATLAVWAITIPLEKDLESIKYSQTVCVILTIFFLLLVLSNTIFTYKFPVYDIFSEPLTLY